MSTKITIVTPCLNQCIFIDQAIRSVLAQSYPDLEYIVVDGQSADGSLAIIESYSTWLTAIVSEKDKGQSDAINKGFRKGSGEIFYWLNADDVLLPGALDIVSDYFQSHPECQWLVGQSVFSDIYLQPGWHHVPKELAPVNYLQFWNGIFLTQPSVFFRRHLFEQVGGLNINLHYTMDLDLWLKFLHITPFHMLPVDLSINRVHQNTKTSTGKELAIDEMASVIFTSALNQLAKYQLPFIQRSLRNYFVAIEKNNFRNGLNENLNKVKSYNLSFYDKMEIFAIAAKRILIQIFRRK